jgi:hypothetical protein
MYLWNANINCSFFKPLLLPVLCQINPVHTLRPYFCNTVKLLNTYVFVRFQVLTAASMIRIVFWDVLPCKMIVDRRFRGAYARQYIPEDNSEHMCLCIWLQTGRTGFDPWRRQRIFPPILCVQTSWGPAGFLSSWQGILSLGVKRGRAWFCPLTPI